MAATERAAEREGIRQRWWAPPAMAGYQSAWLGPDVIAGFTLAAVAIPAAMGYAKIAGTPVATGLYTVLLPVVGFALVGSSRHLVVTADSATAAILFAGLIGFAQPNSSAWVAFASATALLTAAFLFLARIARLGFLADFLSRTVLVGFLSGVGLSLLVGQLPDILGVSVSSRDFVPRLLDCLRALPTTQIPTLAMALAVLAIIVTVERFAPKYPGALLAVVLAIAATWIFGLDQFGIKVVGVVPPGLPPIGLPAVRREDLGMLVGISASIFVVIVAQSAATSRSYAQEHDEPLDENRDLLGLSVANILAGISGTFVVNGSPTKTSVVDAAGGRTQVAHLVTAGVAFAVLLFATAPLERLPNAALAAIVFFIGVRMIDVRDLRQIFHARKLTFGVAIATMLAVVLLGVERGIIVAIGLSILDHLRREYQPKDVVLVLADGERQARKGDPGVETEPGLIVYRLEAPLFFANSDYVAARLQGLVRGAPHPVRWLVLDLIGVSDVDYTAGRMLVSTLGRLRRSGITVALAHGEDIRDDLERYGITGQVGKDHLYDTVREAVIAFRQQAGSAHETPTPAV